MEIAFVQAPRQNRFFLELVAALRDEVERAGAVTSLHWGSFPPPREDLIYLLLPPHEYFTLMHGRIGPGDDVFRRTIFVCAEQPGSQWFEWNAELAPRAGALFDINALAVRSYRRRGLEAEHLQLGWTPRWDHLDTEGDREIDVLFMGCASQRRLEYLSHYATTLWNRRCHLLLSDNSLPNWRSSDSFVADDDKWRLLNQSKLLINLHRDETPYFEWLRVVQAMANGCVVVSEHSLDFAPLQAGRHFLGGRAEELGLLAQHLLEDPTRRWEIQTAAYDDLRGDMGLALAGQRLAAAAHRLASERVPDAADGFFRQPPPTQGDSERSTHWLAGEPPLLADQEVRRALKDVKLDLIDVRRRLDQLTSLAAKGTAPPAIVSDRQTPRWSGARPLVSVLVTLFNYESHIKGALDSVAASTIPSLEVIVVDDASTDSSAEAARRWLADHPQVPALLLRHPVNRGLAHARNAALAFARGEYCFVLDADNEIFPNCIERLVAMLNDAPEAAFAYGLLERFSARGSCGLVNIYPWDPERLRRGNYIDAMALIRTNTLRHFGGYRLDRRLYGWEDYDLWCRMAEDGLRGAQLKTIVARYRMSGHSMLSVTNVSTADARSVISERCPRLMGREAAA